MKTYDSYKDSGVEWLGIIPTNWSTFRLKFCGNIICGGTPSTDNKDFWDGNIPWIQSGKVQFREIRLNDVDKFITAKGLEHSSTKMVKGNSTLIAITGATCSNIGFLTFDSAINQSIVAIEANNSNYSRYIYYYLLSQKHQILSFQSGGAQGGITKRECSNLYIPKIKICEQQQITSFLNTKVSLIDSLIGKTQLKIELLEEKRTAIINAAVTKGLNHNVEMKDSGIEWIGEIPNHWNYIPTKYFTEDKNGVQTGPFGTQLNTKDYVESGVKVMNQKTLIDEDYEIGDEFISQEKFKELSGFDVQQGDIIMGTRGSFGRGKRSTFGKVSIVPEGLGRLVLHPCLIRIRLKKEFVLKRFYYYYVNYSTHFLEDIKKTSNSTTIEVIYGVTLKDIRVPVPPISEQQQIVEHLDEQTQKIDKAISVEERRIDLLKEYRQSLISSVVTGKIKVTEDA